ncbi:hypothetical protein JX265_001311 [Neoarthrinium moseri]|uniref:Uncharacterized protein n=1 Tax=Neoarthrinium moseri TaxID=1658444 RepID=A0A9P9WXJ2_9PEZI|nr:hypothetical protein JX265_001311 [Neoarthrinium moseri]
MAGVDYDEIAVMDDLKDGEGEPVGGGGLLSAERRGGRGGCDGAASLERSPHSLSKTRSLSDGGGAQLSPSPFIVEARRTSKDDSSLRDPSSTTAASYAAPPVTPRRPDFALRGLSLQMPSSDASTPAQAQAAPYVKPSPLSPKLDQSHIYASPTNILPRRSRGMDFSRAATSLHHSTLAEQSSPDTSPTICGGRAVNIPGRAIGDFGAELRTNSLWSMMGNQERNRFSSSVGSANHAGLGSDSSSSSDDDDLMDEEMDDAFLGTPQAAKTTQGAGIPWMPGNSPAANSLSSFRSRPRKPPKKRLRGLLGLGFNPAAPSGLSKSPPSNGVMKEMKDSSGAHSRRESISWAANQLHISADNDDKALDSIEIPKDGQRGVIRRAVTRRSNLLPKTKGFARIRAALAEEGAPVDSEFRREAEVIRQVRESDMDLEPRMPPPLDISTAKSSPNLNNDNLDDVLDEDLLGDPGLSSSFKQQALKNSKGKQFWDNFSETSSVAGSRVTPPPPAFLPRGSSSGISEDVNMDSPLTGTASLFGPGPALAMIGNESDSQRSDTPQVPGSASGSQGPRIPPTAEEITRRINNKRRRDDDFDSNSFKRRAVSPGMSVHNSPIMQSPLQRDMAPWGSRPGSNHGGDKASGTPSENGSNNGGANNGRPINGAKGRVGFQGMVDTNDGLMRMSIE